MVNTMRYSYNINTLFIIRLLDWGFWFNIQLTQTKWWFLIPLQQNYSVLSFQGSIVDIPVDDAVVNVVNMAVEQLVSQDPRAQSLGLLSIEKARRQIVAGYLYFIDALIREGKGKIKKCSMQILMQDWKSDKPVGVTARCDDNRRYRYPFIIDWRFLPNSRNP